MGHLTKFDQSQSIGFYKHTLWPNPRWSQMEKSLSIITISNIELEQAKSIINRDIMQLEQSIRERYE